MFNRKGHKGEAQRMRRIKASTKHLLQVLINETVIARRLFQPTKQSILWGKRTM